MSENHDLLLTIDVRRIRAAEREGELRELYTGVAAQDACLPLEPRFFWCQDFELRCRPWPDVRPIQQRQRSTQEHDFGAIEIDGDRYFWKIDHYDSLMVGGSEDPTDPGKTTRVLTIMRADEY